MVPSSAAPLRVALGLSGGVDSAVSAHLLQQAGYDVTGVYIECWHEPGCRAEQDKQDALKVALQLQIPFKTLDFRQAYQDQVLSYFLSEYQAGRTPNPDVLCNKVIKFGLFYQWAREQHFDYIATGHYAKIIATPKQWLTKHPTTHAHQLALCQDHHKDQTYFLNLLQGEQLDHILFPLSTYTKDQIRSLATQLKLPVADKPDSTGICFVGEIDVTAYLKEKLGNQPGPITDQFGQVIGQHSGLWFYTIGQRHGFTVNMKQVLQVAPQLINDKHQIKPLYVIKKDVKANSLVVGTTTDRLTKTLRTQPPHWLDSALAVQLLADQSAQLLVRIRHTGALTPVTIQTQTDNSLIMRARQPLQGVACGQSAVLYVTHPDSDDTICLGGAVME